MFTLSCKHSANVTITGSLDSAEGTIVKIEDANHPIAYDSTTVKNGKFNLTISLPDEGFYELVFYTQTPASDKGRWVHQIVFYAENLKKHVFSANGPTALSYNYNWQSSSYNQNKLKEFNALVKLKRDTLQHKRKYYLNEADKALNADKNIVYNAYLDSATKAEDEIRNAYLYATHQFIRSNPNTVVTPYLITEVYDMFENYALYKKAMATLSPIAKNNKYYKEADALLQSAQKINIGTVIPQLAGKTLNGSDFKMNYTGKKIILLDFWASYCAPCRQQIPDMKKLYDQYKNKGFDIISVSIDEDPLKWGRASKQDSIPWHNIAELTDQSNSKNIKNFVVKSIPANYVLNNKGELIGRNVELDSLEKILKKIK
ncbi:AhpC/TSA family protein [Mucilaginibacter rigui]|uniref:AhpC/TSA family protein n=1 Tax=Mucilaginibacter rigui TaxID=534635 RepID=A0ABR7X7N0_9SPHI|nr:TlpA disulfide reductase family protein [Mucilaginibacter rigui]MBD1386608.1 AhpC/TSA family protein [Mucilaginibacter rigui]